MARFDPRNTVHERKKSVNWTPSKLKIFDSKRPYAELEREAANWEKVFANHICDKGLAHRIYKEPQNPTVLGSTSRIMS